ncbi:Oidioi.mRNA.OKI2018_I69.PAR.g8624.t1.cds [Oikopleura dioica]|uniref:Oidioi.mRNA.OKI2018_I69.PAR.g8624.t1.cds n=1 Tax=Oikopleura dioica TaxID=34765 RepID=A0ABN7RL27_OIKDI|nr:Oidioi.mRNA.OKI2018_I69.PAR.g8624.t1.cds [Oikopleura dioica]
MLLLILLFSISSALWPPKQTPRIIRATSVYYNNQTQWKDKYANWNDPETIALEEVFRNEIEAKIGGEGVTIDILWFQSSNYEFNSGTSTAAVFSRFETTDENFHTYSSSFSELLEAHPNSFAEWKTMIEPLHNKMNLLIGIIFRHPTECDLTDDMTSILCKNLWKKDQNLPGNKDGCSVWNTDWDKTSDQQYYFKAEVLDMFHLDRFGYIGRYPPSSEPDADNEFPVNYFSYFWLKELMKNSNFTCIKEGNYPDLAYIDVHYYGDSDDPLTNNEIKYCSFGAVGFLLAISSVFLRFFLARRYAIFSFILVNLIMAAFVVYSFFLWFDFDNEFKTFYMMPTCLSISVAYIIYSTLACCCSRKKYWSEKVKPEDDEDEGQKESEGIEAL